MINQVPIDQVVAIWRDVEPLILKGLAYTNGEFDQYDALRYLLQREWQLWVGVADGETGIVLTHVVNYSNKKVCRVILMVGENVFDTWFMEFVSAVEAWAKTIGCDEIEEYGRPGWEKIGPKVGWHKRYVVMAKKL